MLKSQEKSRKIKKNFNFLNFNFSFDSKTVLSGLRIMNHSELI